jgi:hypothetical protein
MKIANALLISILLLTFTSCEAIGNIFGAGVYVGVFISILLVGLLIYVVAKISKRD